MWVGTRGQTSWLGLDWVTVNLWIGLDWIYQNGPMSNSGSACVTSRG